MEDNEPIGFSHNNINIVEVGNSGFPCDILGINRTDNSKQDNIRRIEAEKKHEITT